MSTPEELGREKARFYKSFLKEIVPQPKLPANFLKFLFWLLLVLTLIYLYLTV